MEDPLSNKMLIFKEKSWMHSAGVNVQLLLGNPNRRRSCQAAKGSRLPVLYTQLGKSEVRSSLCHQPKPWKAPGNLLSLEDTDGSKGCVWRNAVAFMAMVVVLFFIFSSAHNNSLACFKKDQALGL